MQLDFTTDHLLKQARRFRPTPVRKHVSGDTRNIDIFVKSIGSGDFDFLAYKDDDLRPFGHLRFAGPHSGTIWSGSNLMAEFDKDIDPDIDLYVVIEIRDGLKIPGSKQYKDPLVYLLESEVKEGTVTTN